MTFPFGNVTEKPWGFTARFPRGNRPMFNIGNSIRWDRIEYDYDYYGTTQKGVCAVLYDSTFNTVIVEDGGGKTGVGSFFGNNGYIFNARPLKGNNVTIYDASQVPASLVDACRRGDDRVITCTITNGGAHRIGIHDPYINEQYVNSRRDRISDCPYGSGGFIYYGDKSYGAIDFTGISRNGCFYTGRLSVDSNGVCYATRFFAFGFGRLDVISFNNLYRETNPDVDLTDYLRNGGNVRLNDPAGLTSLDDNTLLRRLSYTA